MLSLNVDYFTVYVLYPQPVTAGKRRIYFLHMTYGILILVLLYHLFIHLKEVLKFHFTISFSFSNHETYD